MAADVVNAVTGIDPMADFRGSYKTGLGAYRILAKLGGIERAWADRVGKEIHPNLAQAGDIGITGDAVVFFGGQYWMAASDVGLISVNAPRVAWRCHV